VSANENKIYTEKDFYLAFRDLKKKQNLSLGQIAIRTGLSKSFLSDIMNNKVLPPKDEFIEKNSQSFRGRPCLFF
jgi:transcriptional regulator with XRE-family HTH domain